MRELGTVAKENSSNNKIEIGCRRCGGSHFRIEQTFQALYGTGPDPVQYVDTNYVCVSCGTKTNEQDVSCALFKDK